MLCCERRQVSCRADLEREAEERQAFGALDGKVTNSTLMNTGVVFAVSGAVLRLNT